MDILYQVLSDKFKEKGLSFYEIEDNEILERICRVWLKNEDIPEIPDDELSANEAYYYGLKCQVNKNYDEMKIKYQIAIDKGHSGAMAMLGKYYETIDDELAINYYLMAIDKGLIKAHYALGKFYLQKNMNEEGEKYLLTAAENGIMEAYKILADYYHYKDRSKALIYYAHYSLDKACDMIKYTSEGSEKNFMLRSLLKEWKTLFDENKELKKELETLREEIKFIPGYGEYFKEAEEDFNQLNN